MLGTIPLHPKLAWFARDMQRELRHNLHKGDWETWKNPIEIIAELEYHKAKLIMAIREKNREAAREYLADCGTILMFYGNAYGLFEPLAIETVVLLSLESDQANRLATDLCRSICQTILCGTDRTEAIDQLQRGIALLSVAYPSITDSAVRDEMAYFLDQALLQAGLDVTTLNDFTLPDEPL